MENLNLKFIQGIHPRSSHVLRAQSIYTGRYYSNVIGKTRFDDFLDVTQYRHKWKDLL